MLIKWITCRVVDRDAFHAGQRAWARLRGHPGLLGQCGGWSRRDHRLAHIVACWAQEAAYRRFMADGHDQVAAAQSGSYDTIEVRLFDHCLDIGAGLRPDDSRPALLRLAHGRIRPHRKDHVVRAQAEVWNPAMSSAPGMLGGSFALRGDAEFLVVSQWRTSSEHESYRSDRFPALHARSGIARDATSVTGDLVDVEPAWA